MKTKLIIYNNKPIIVSNEEIKEGDTIFNKFGIKHNEQIVSTCSFNAEINWRENMKINDGKIAIRDNVFKIIAGIDNFPEIDFNGLEKEFFNFTKEDMREAMLFTFDVFSEQLSRNEVEKRIEIYI